MIKLLAVHKVVMLHSAYMGGLSECSNKLHCCMMHAREQGHKKSQLITAYNNEPQC